MPKQDTPSAAPAATQDVIASRGDEKMTATEHRAWTEGRRMRWNGKPRASCRFKAVHLVEAWVQGWDSRDGEAKS